MEWGFIWLMFMLKIPIVMLLLLVWWAVRSPEEPVDEGSDDGGTKVDPQHPHGSHRGPRRRGPHGDPVLPGPPRVRTTPPSRPRVMP